MPVTAIVVAWLVSVNVVALTVVGSIASENVAVGAIALDTPVAPLTGDVPVTVGGVVSGGGADATVKVQVASAARGLPARSLTPAEPPLTRAR